MAAPDSSTGCDGDAGRMAPAGRTGLPSSIGSSDGAGDAEAAAVAAGGPSLNAGCPAPAMGVNGPVGDVDHMAMTSPLVVLRQNPPGTKPGRPFGGVPVGASRCSMSATTSPNHQPPVVVLKTRRTSPCASVSCLSSSFPEYGKTAMARNGSGFFLGFRLGFVRRLRGDAEAGDGTAAAAAESSAVAEVAAADDVSAAAVASEAPATAERAETPETSAAAAASAAAATLTESNSSAAAEASAASGAPA